MSIADKLTTIAENQRRVYDAGYAVADHHGQITANLRYEEGLQEGYQNGKTDGISQGEQNAYDAFWDTHQQNGERRNYNGGFAGNGWTNDTFYPKYPIIANQADFMFRDSKIANINVPIRVLSNSFQEAFRASFVENVQEIILTQPTNVLSWMSYASFIKEIRITCEGTGCLGRTDVTCTVDTLSHDSLVSIGNALQDLVPLGKTFIWNIGSTNQEKLAIAEIAIATQKGWTIV